MSADKPSPLQAGFWLTVQERRYILIICALLFIGLVARYYHLRHETLGEEIPAGIAQMEHNYE